MSQREGAYPCSGLTASQLTPHSLLPMFLAHCFRLRDPWQCECTPDGATRWSRVFHRPTGLETDDALWLVCSGLPAGRRRHLQRRTPHAAATTPARINTTSPAASPTPTASKSTPLRPPASSLQPPASAPSPTTSASASSAARRDAKKTGGAPARSARLATFEFVGRSSRPRTRQHRDATGVGRRPLAARDQPRHHERGRCGLRNQ